MRQKIIQLVKNLYDHKFIRYLFVGGTTFVLQSGLLILLHGVWDISLPIATSIAYWISVLYHFCLNRWWAFSASQAKSIHKHATAYIVLLIFNYLTAVIFVHFASRIVNYAIANALVVIIQMSWNYYMYKNFIFNKKEV